MKNLLSISSLLLGMMINPTLARAASRDHYLAGQVRPWQPRLLVREHSPANGDCSHPVLYVHGSTFPSALSIMFELEGRSWADDLNAAGYDVYGLDFAGYGGSDRYPVISGREKKTAPRGRAQEASEQIGRAVRFILKKTGAERVSIIAHSWGTMGAGRFAGQYPELVDKLVLFGPVVQRQGPKTTDLIPPYNDVTVQTQHTRFLGGVPIGEQPVLVESDFPRWASDYVASDGFSGTRTSASVRIPSGPDVDVAAAWSGQLPWDPARIHAPTLIIRGAWDGVTTDADADWLRNALTHSAYVAMVKVPRATHLMHLEVNRTVLYKETIAFLNQHAPTTTATMSSEHSRTD